jgi:hypothetical protein
MPRIQTIRLADTSHTASLLSNGPRVSKRRPRKFLESFAGLGTYTLEISKLGVGVVPHITKKKCLS